MRDVYFLSNRTAITAETLGHSLLAQFPFEHFNSVPIPFIDTVEKANAAVAQINASSQGSDLIPIVFSTLADKEISKIISLGKALILDPFEQFLPRLEKLLSASPSHESRWSHRIADSKLYESRIDAIDFSLIHDDGATTRNYAQTDIIVIGVSRSGKTPSCLYLALQFGIKAANYPITEEDFESIQLPEPIRPYNKRLYGLTTDANRLAHIRQARRPDSSYASLQQCRYEIKAAEELFSHHRIPFLNTSTMSVEEIAARIVEESGLHRIETM